MQYTVTYKCGHEGTEQIYGKSEDRQRKIDWYKRERVCPTCYKTQKAATAKASDKEMGLVELIGSEKQTAWARSIRAEFLQGSLKYVPDTEDGHLAKRYMVEAANSLGKAKWWIDNRSNLRSAFGPVYEKIVEREMGE